jgi:hypothetical protein
MDQTDNIQHHNATAAATVNNTLVQSGKVNVAFILATNEGGAAAFVKLFDKAVAPIAGTDTPFHKVVLPPTSTVLLALPRRGLKVQLGLGYAITNLIADNDNTAVAASQVKLSIGFEAA